jgi:NAD(P)-dependent dehydrogenase (short-subunit alcohol dehydrogenase family)
MTGGRFGAETTADEVLEGINLRGKTVLVTGASAGLGVETVRALASHGATVIAGVRDRSKAEKALAEAGVAVGEQVSLEEVDLASLASVRAFTDRIAARVDRLDLLIGNAGIMACPEARTADGFELQFGTNHLGHFVLVNRLVPLLLAGAPSRVVNFETTPYEPWLAYGRSKTANAQFAVELDRRLRDRGVRAVAVHPGGIDTELFRHLDEEQLAFVAASGRASRKTVGQGVATGLWAGVVADADEVGGKFAEDCAVAEVFDGQFREGPTGVRSYVYDTARTEGLWRRSEELVGETFAP